MQPLGINGLVKVNPEHPGKKSDRGRERQEQYGGPEDDFGDPPARQITKQYGDLRHDQNAHQGTEIHCAQKKARFAFELEIADGTALAHLWESPEDGVPKDSADAAAGATLLENACES